jgi:hypothetical protein
LRAGELIVKDGNARAEGFCCLAFEGVWGSEKAGNQKQVRGLREVAHGAHSFTSESEL